MRITLILTAFILFTNANGQTFSITSTQNFTLGCSTKSVCGINVITLTMPPNPINYTLTGPGPGPVSSGVISAQNLTINIPGTWTLTLSNGPSVTNIPIAIIQNTFLPFVGVFLPQQVLDCNTPSTTLHALPDTTLSGAGVNYKWSFSPFSTVNGNTLAVNANVAHPTNTLINIYTLTVTDTNNACKSFTVIPMYQDLFPPLPIISEGNNIVDCIINYPAILVNQSVSGIPINSGFPVTLPVVSSWYKLSTPTLVTNASSIQINLPAAYVMTATDLNNGCKSSKTIDVCTALQKNLISFNRLTIFPNPNSGVFTIPAESLIKNIIIEVYNSLGLLVKKQTLDSENALIDLQSEANGIYIILILEDTKAITISKMVKQ